MCRSQVLAVSCLTFAVAIEARLYVAQTFCMLTGGEKDTEDELTRAGGGVYVVSPHAIWWPGELHSCINMEIRGLAMVVEYIFQVI